MEEKDLQLGKLELGRPVPLDVRGVLRILVQLVQVGAVVEGHN
jgi:hypothetical protein